MWIGLLFGCSTNPLADLTFELDGVLTDLVACDDVEIAIRDDDQVVRLAVLTPTDAGGEPLVANAGEDVPPAEFSLPDEAVTVVLFLGGELTGCGGGEDGYVDHAFVPTAGLLQIAVAADASTVTVTLDDATFRVEGDDAAGPTLTHGAWTGPIAAP